MGQDQRGQQGRRVPPVLLGLLGRPVVSGLPVPLGRGPAGSCGQTGHRGDLARRVAGPGGTVLSATGIALFVNNATSYTTHPFGQGGTTGRPP